MINPEFVENRPEEEPNNQAPEVVIHFFDGQQNFLLNLYENHFHAEMYEIYVERLADQSLQFSSPIIRQDNASNSGKYIVLEKAEYEALMKTFDALDFDGYCDLLKGIINNKAPEFVQDMVEGNFSLPEELDYPARHLSVKGHW